MPWPKGRPRGPWPAERSRVRTPCSAEHRAKLSAAASRPRPHLRLVLDEPLFKQMYYALFSFRQVALTFGCSYTHVLNTAKRLGLPTRRPGVKLGRPSRS